MPRFIPLIVLPVIALAACRGPSSAPLETHAPTPARVPGKEEPFVSSNIALRSLGQRVPVIMWHDIIEVRGPESQWFDCTTEEFEQQMQWLYEQAAIPISLAQLHRHLSTGERLPDRAVVLTFDDNYQGFYDRALPILRRFNFPAAVFVHTGFVGNKEGLHPKMDWNTLREILKDPLVTIGSHTVSHPDDMSLLPPETQRTELADSKTTLERELGVDIDFLAFPNGKGDETSQALARELGYKMAFSIDNLLAEESPSVFFVGRYVHTRLEKAFEDRERGLRGGAADIFESDIKSATVRYQEDRIDGIRLAWVSGGTPMTVLSAGREGVLDFVKREKGVAGINGGFFAVSEIASSDNRMVGPVRTRSESFLTPDLEKARWPKLRNRPVVMWGKKRLAIVPYHPEIMIDDAALREILPEFSDVFLAGVWLVHGSVPRTAEDLQIFGSKDIEDHRRRAFFGATADGQIVVGASQGSIKSSQFAAAIAGVGIAEAVLLDSGFSTSLIFNGQVKVSGHSRAGVPSRPVPHAIVVQGALEKPATATPRPPAARTQSD